MTALKYIVAIAGVGLFAASALDLISEDIGLYAAVGLTILFVVLIVFGRKKT